LIDFAGLNYFWMMCFVCFVLKKFGNNDFLYESEWHESHGNNMGIPRFPRIHKAKKITWNKLIKFCTAFL